MTKKLLPIYATLTDCAAVIQAVNTCEPLTLTRAGTIDSAIVLPLEIDEPLQGHLIYLIGGAGTKISARPVKQYDDSARWIIDQLENPATIAFDVGGLTFQGRRLIAGQVGTIQSDSYAQSLYKIFEKQIRNTFVKVKSYYVGPEAYEMLKAGVRLSPTEKSSEEYDLKL